MKWFIVGLVLVFSAPVYANKGPMILSLDEAIDIALKNNKGMLAAREKIREAEGGIITARAGFLPSLSLSGSYTRIAQIPAIEFPVFGVTEVPVFSQVNPLDTIGVTYVYGITGTEAMEFSTADNYATRATLQQPIFTWGRISNAYSLALANLKAARADYQKAINDLRFNVTQSFYGVILAKEFAKLSEDSYAQLERHVGQVEDLYDAGMASKFDLLRTRVQLANVQPQVIRAKNGLALAESALKMLLGVDLDTELNLKGELTYEPCETGLTEATKTALQQRPELIAMKYRKKMTEKGVAIAKAANKPNIFVACNYDYKKPRMMLETGWGSDWNVTIGLSLPIFTGFSYFGNLRQATAQLGQVKFGIEQLVDGIKLEVKEAILDLEQNKEILEAQKDNVTQAGEALDIAEERYKNGLITNLEYMDAQLALTRARVEYLQTLADYRIAKAKLEKAMGM